MCKKIAHPGDFQDSGGQFDKGGGEIGTPIRAMSTYSL